MESGIAVHELWRTPPPLPADPVKPSRVAPVYATATIGTLSAEALRQQLYDAGYPSLYSTLDYVLLQEVTVLPAPAEYEVFRISGRDLDFPEDCGLDAAREAAKWLYGLEPCPAELVAHLSLLSILPPQREPRSSRAIMASIRNSGFRRWFIFCLLHHEDGSTSLYTDFAEEIHPGDTQWLACREVKK